MPLIRPVALFLTSFFVLSASAAGRVEVRVADDRQFVDVGGSPSERAANLAVLVRHFESLGARLPDGRTLSIDVLDVDLAGHLKPVRGGPDRLRVVEGGVDGPALQLRYELRSADRTLASGAESLSDPSFLVGHEGEVRREPLARERRLIDTWFARRFATDDASTAP